MEDSVLAKVHETDPGAELLTFNLEEAGKDQLFLKVKLEEAAKSGRSVIIKFDLRNLGQERIKIGAGRITYKDFKTKVKNFYLNFRQTLRNISISCSLFYHGEDHSGGFIHILHEALKNAFVHGNRFNFNIPIYMYFNPQHNTVMIFDGNINEDVNDLAYVKEKSITSSILHSTGAGLDRSIGFGLAHRDKVGHAVIMVFKEGLFKDNAQLVQKEAMKVAGAKKTTGGIDLTPANMNLQTKMTSPQAGDDSGIKFHINPAMLARLRDAPGFMPVIVSVEPLKDLKRFLGVIVNQT